MRMNDLEVMAARALIFELAVLVLALALTIWISYLILKHAIKNGINESVLGDRRPIAPAARQDSTAAPLPDMRADR